jgi:thiamine biosynthesis protein ThiS
MKVNGVAVEIEGNQVLSVADFLAGRGIDPAVVAIELNGVIIPRISYAARWLKNEDLWKLSLCWGADQWSYK